MSTRLLIAPGKVYQLCDDLESLWFVLLYEGLHYLKHNKPSAIRMQILFDHVDVCPETGTHTGGVGKRDLYTFGEILMTETLQFESKPFTTLIGQVYWLFHALNAYHKKLDLKKKPGSSILDSCEKLESCAEIKRLLTEALGSDEWPETCDKVKDQYPPKNRLTPQEKDTIALSFVNRSLITPGEPSGTKRKRDERDEVENPPPIANKRQKIQPLWERIRSRFKGFWR